MHSPFVFCKGPYLTSQHRYRVKSFSAAHTQPCFLLTPLLQRLPNAAIVCLALGHCLCVHWERPEAGSSTSPGWSPRTDRETDPILPSRSTDPLLPCQHHPPERTHNTEQLSQPNPTQLDCGCEPIIEILQHRALVASRNTEQENRTLQKFESSFCTSFLFSTCNI